MRSCGFLPDIGLGWGIELQTSVLLKPGHLGPAPDTECLTSGVDAETVGADCAPIDGDGKTIGGNVLIPGGEW